MKDGQANVPVGLEKADEVPARLHSTAGVVLGGPLDLVGRERMPAVALAGNSDRRLSASPPGDGRSWEASSGGLGSAGCVASEVPNVPSRTQSVLCDSGADGSASGHRGVPALASNYRSHRVRNQEAIELAEAFRRHAILLDIGSVSTGTWLALVTGRWIAQGLAPEARARVSQLIVGPISDWTDFQKKFL